MSTENGLKFSPASNSTAINGVPGKLKQRRSRKACQHCHTRKIRCNVLETGTPCSNCVDAGTTCVIRRRKNQRRDSTPPEHDGHQSVVADHSHTWRLSNAATAPSAASPWEQHGLRQQPALQPRGPVATGTNPIDSKAYVLGGFERRSQSSNSPPSTDGRGWADMTPTLTWDPHAMIDAPSNSCDFSHLTEMDDIFTFSGNNLLPSLAPNDFGWTPGYAAPVSGPAPTQLSPPPPVLALAGHDFHTNGSRNMMPGSHSNMHTSVHIPGLNDKDREYLRNEGCFNLPPGHDLRQMMNMYFQMNHPNLPIIAEDRFWSLWNGEKYSIEGFSFLLLRAMIFAVTSYCELDMLQSLGFATKREARSTYYRQAKLLYDFGIEPDPAANAQACLLLSYIAPSYSIMRYNESWLLNAVRLARIARADTYWRVPDHNRQKLLKRIWWGVIFRDRTISLGLRHSLTVELDPAWVEGERHILTVEDFRAEIGHSPVHNADTQLRIVEVLGATCRLMQCLSNACRILYKYEHLDDRLEMVSKSISPTVEEIQWCLKSFRTWHDVAIRSFPFPVSLDDSHNTICVYANMMFSYHAAAVFGLNTFLILLGEIFTKAKRLFSVEEAREALENAHNDVARRTQELVQVRLVKFLPISASAVLALPLILQAINVAAAHEPSMKAIETRRLDVFTRTLKTQQESFDSSDYCADVLGKIVEYAYSDTTLVKSMTAARDSKDPYYNASSNSQSHDKIKVDWANLVHKRPRLFLRFVLYLDVALCSGASPHDEDFPLELRRGVA